MPRRKGFTHDEGEGTPEWFTPPRVFDAMGETFDLDPCSPGAHLVPWLPAKKHLTVVEDGLRTPWDPGAFVFCNPPYGDMTRAWLQKFADHGCGVSLTFSRTDTRWWHESAVRADAMLFTAGRVHFLRPDWTVGDGGAGSGSVLTAFGARAVQALERASRNGIDGWLVHRKGWA